MDIELLSRMVGELIVDHDMVGLPGVGTFVAEVVPASFSDKGYTINPPYRRLSFHPSRGEEDLLIDLYSTTNGINREAARIYLTQFLLEMKTVLKDRKTIVFPGLGRLRATKENNFFFVQDQEIDLFPEGYALPALSLKAQPDDSEPVRINVPPIDLKAAMQPEQPEVVNEDASSGIPEEEAEQPVEFLDQETEAFAEDAEEAPVPDATSAEAEPVLEFAEEPELSEPESILEPAPISEPEASEPEVPVEPVPASAPQQSSRTDSHPRPSTSHSHSHSHSRSHSSGHRAHGNYWWIPVVVVVALAVTALAIFLILASVAPDFIDSILYTPEELRIINY